MIDIAITKKLRKYDGSNTLVVNASFKSQAVTHITGPSGAGKTTLLRIVAGLIRPDEGRIVCSGEIWTDTRDGIFASPQARNVGMVFQDYALFPNMTVIEHLKFGTNETLFIDELISFAGLQPFTKHKPHQLSGGQQQRLAIIRALCTKPQWLFMDEPFSALNKELMHTIMAELKALLVRLQISCLLVSHQSDMQSGFADEVFELI